MTADVLSLDNPRVSARAEIPCFDTVTLTAYERPILKALDHLMRQVGRKADETFGAGSPRRSTIWVTYEEIFEPETEAA